MRHTASLNILRFALAPFAAIRGLENPCVAAWWRLAPPCDFRLVPGASVAPFGSVELAAAVAHLLGLARGRAFYYCATGRVLLRHRAHVPPNPLKGLPLLGKLYLYSSSMASVLICV